MMPDAVRPSATMLQVEGYTLDYRVSGQARRVLDDVSLHIAPGEVLGLIGESGSGKSSLASAILRALPRNAREGGGRIALAGQDLRSLPEPALRSIRGRRIGMVFQDPSTVLNPTLTIGRQVREVLRLHLRLDVAAAQRAAIEALGHVGLRDPAAIMRRYPHQVSGGEKQRVIIATAFATRPELLILDEPTTALDVITGARILDLFARLRAETGIAALYISHDLALVTRVADRVAVLQGGRVVEEAAASRIFASPAHPYTRDLAAAVPRPGRRLPTGTPGAPLLELDGVGVTYARRRLFAPPPPATVRDVSFALREGEILGIVGESGSGKSTLARALTGLVPHAGSIRLRGTAAGRMGRAYRRAVQIVFQHPDASLNPRHTVGGQIARPMQLFGAQGRDIRQEVGRLLEQVRLPASYAGRYPHQLSGGEKQRVAIARAFAARPSLVICDEITAPLDVSVQASVIELLLELHRAHGTAYLFITHDLNLVRQIAHRIAVMQGGRLVDLRDTDAIAAGEGVPYTRALIEASPHLPQGAAS